MADQSIESTDPRAQDGGAALREYIRLHPAEVGTVASRARRRDAAKYDALAAVEQRAEQQAATLAGAIYGNGGAAA